MTQSESISSTTDGEILFFDFGDGVHFTFFPEYVSNHDSLYGGAKLLILPSRHEGIINVLLESQAWVLPAVVSDIPGTN